MGLDISLDTGVPVSPDLTKQNLEGKWYDRNGNYVGKISFNGNTKRPLLAVATLISDLSIWNLNTAVREYRNNRVSNSDTLQVKFNRNGTQFITYDWGYGNVILWDARNFKQLYDFPILPEPRYSIYDVDFSYDNQYIVAGSYFTSYVINLNTKQVERLLTPPITDPRFADYTRYEDDDENEVTSIRYLPNGHIIASYNGKIIEWDPSPKMLVSCSICSISRAIHVCTDCSVKLCDLCITECQ